MVARILNRAVILFAILLMGCTPDNYVKFEVLVVKGEFSSAFRKLIPELLEHNGFMLHQPIDEEDLPGWYEWADGIEGGRFDCKLANKKIDLAANIYRDSRQTPQRSLVKLQVEIYDQMYGVSDEVFSLNERELIANIEKGLKEAFGENSVMLVESHGWRVP